MKFGLIVAAILFAVAFAFISAEDAKVIENLAGQDQFLSSVLK